MGILSECLVLVLLCQALSVLSSQSQAVGSPLEGGVREAALLEETEERMEFQPGEEMRVNFEKRGKNRKNGNSGSGASCKEPALKKKRNQKQLNNDILAWHNYYRCLHGVGELTYDNKLEKVAKANVKMNVRDGGMEHTDRNIYGENLWAKMGTHLSMRDITGQDPVFGWYNEMNKPGYRWGSNPTMWSYGTGHFTQVVWKGTNKLGCWTEEHPYQGGQWTRVFTACVYDPAGNVSYRNEAKNIQIWNTNVPPPKK